MRLDADYGKFGSSRSVVNGDRAWSENFGRFEELHGKRLEQAIQSHPAAITDDWRDSFDAIRVLNTGDMNGRKVYVLKLQRGELPPITIYVDTDTGDLLKSETIVLAQAGIAIPVVDLYEDFREIHGIRIPFRSISSNEASGRAVIQYDTIEVDVEVSDDIFTLTIQPEREIPGGAPLASLIFEGAEYTFNGYLSVAPGEPTALMTVGVDVNVAELGVVGTTTQGPLASEPDCWFTGQQ